MIKRSIFTISALTVVTATAGVGSAIATTGNGVDRRALRAQAAVAATTTATTAAPVAAVEPAAAEAFEAFSDLPASPMPASVAAAVGSPTKFGRNPDLARSVDTATGKGWLIPGRGYVCLAVPMSGVDAYATTCQPTAIAATDGVQIAVADADTSGQVDVTTVAPEGADVVAVAPDGSTTKDPTVDGVSTTTVPADTTVTVAP